MKKVSEATMAKELIDQTLKLADEHGGLRGVTLREITKRAGCKHTNIYNYFESFEDLIWAALGEVIIQNIEYSDLEFEECCEAEKLLVRFAGRQIEYAVDHPGLYRLMFLENIKGVPPADIVEIMHRPYKEFLKFIRRIVKVDKSDAEIYQIADVLHGYLHGEICKMIENRFLDRTKEEYSADIIKNIKKIFLLFNGN